MDNQETLQVQKRLKSSGDRPMQMVNIAWSDGPRKIG